MLTATIEGIGFWTQGLPTWDAAVAFAHGADLQDTPARPSPSCWPPTSAGARPTPWPCRWTRRWPPATPPAATPPCCHRCSPSTHGDLAITDYMCTTLASDPTAISPTKFHNSVHNAAAGYWTIGAGAMTPTTALSAGAGSFAQGLLEALMQLGAGAEAVLLVGYDARSIGPLGRVSPSEGLFGAALVLGAPGQAGKPQLALRFDDGVPTPGDGPLARYMAANAMAPMLPLFDSLAAGGTHTALYAGPGRVLQVEVQP